MKHLILSLFAMTLSAAGMAQCVDRIVPYDGGKVTITSPDKLFSGCEMRLCRWDRPQSQKVFAIQLDLTDRAEHVCQGNLLTIHFKDGTRISLTNMQDTQADITHESYIDTRQHTYTDIVPVYDGWYDAIYGVPVTGTYTENVPVSRTTSFLSLFYILSPKDIEKIAQGKVSQISLVTDQQTIIKKARPLSEAIAAQYNVLKQ